MKLEDILSHALCDVESRISAQREVIQGFPSQEDDEGIMKWGLSRLQEAANSATKESKKRKLELELLLLDKPQDCNLDDEENQHVSLHIDADQLYIELRRREGETWGRFIEIIKNRR